MNRRTVRAWLRGRYEHMRDREQILPLAVLATLAVLALGAWAGRPAYQHWRASRALNQARAFLAQNDLAGARLALGTALRGGVTDAALATLADYYERGGSPEAVAVRQELWRRHPEDFVARLAWASAALRFDDRATARLALAGCTPEQKQTADYLRVAAALALLEGANGEADVLLGELGARIALTPEIRLLHATVQLRSRDPARVRAARAELQALAQTPVQAVPALRVLLADAFARRDPLDAGEIGAALARSPTAGLGDWLDAAAALKLSRPTAPLDRALAEKIRAAAAVDATAAAHYARWLAVQEGVAEAAAWIDAQPATLADQPALRATRADLALACGEWARLRALLAAGAWGALPADCLDFAFATRLALSIGETARATRIWTQAVEEARASAPALRALLRLAPAWQWPRGRREALRTLVLQFPEDAAAYREWVSLLRAEGDSAGLLECLRARKEAGGELGNESQDWALLSLLVAPTRTPNEATRVLETLYRRDPANPFYVTNQAFVLWQLGQTVDAAALAAQLPAAERAMPARAPYLAIVLATAGRREEAREVLRHAPARTALLREEAALLDRAEELLRP
ncbi:MAG: hypothetical protein HYV96_20210 [Opitutae bacterium]|nr:hypothetical protein [Opitutae bacterium]